MNAHKLILNFGIVLACVSVPSCTDYLTAPEPSTTLVKDFYNSSAAAIQNVTACYVPLMWEFNNTYFSEWFIGDIMSDDALKGGQNTSDMGASYDMENWKTTSTNTLLLDFYRAQYQGIGRCNLALANLPEMQCDDAAWTSKLQNRLIGEACFLRAYYYFRLLRVFGGTPISTKVIDSSEDWQQPRASVEDMFMRILADLEEANTRLWTIAELSKDKTQIGRATKGAAQAMLMKTYLYMASPYWNKQISQDAETCYQLAKAWGDSVITSNVYSLCPDYHDNFTLLGENGPESVFEIQYMEIPWGDYGEGYGYTAGSFTQVLTRSRSTKKGGGWGFNHPTQNLYDEFEPTDTIRLGEAIYNPADSLIENESQEIYLGSRYLNNKYAMYEEYPEGWDLHASRGPLNNKQIRYADVLLMYAEACLNSGDEATAIAFINEVRERVHLPEVGKYTIKINGVEITSPTTEQLLKHERRMELAMEGHRWFDLVRWGNTKQHMDAYAATESEEAKAQMAAFVEGKHEIFPIPDEERELNPMPQNNGYN